MSYYFPFGGADSISVLNVSFSYAAVTASVPSAITITSFTASFVTTSGSNPPAGSNGQNKTVELCGSSTVSGPQGNQGETGSKGSDNNQCPDGTIECTSLNQYLPNLNNLRPSGSQFSKVCMQIPEGCTELTATCPPYLPSASVTSVFPTIT